MLAKGGLALPANATVLRRALSSSDSTAQVTLALLKPDICADADLERAVHAAITDASLKVVAQQRLLWTPAEAGAFYAEHKGRFFYERLCGYMSSGPFRALVLQGDGAISRWRKMIGPTHPVRARMHADDTLRAFYGLTDTRNSFHGSDSPDTAAREIAFFFPDLVIQSVSECAQYT